jgi:hypothetical protein
MHLSYNLNSCKTLVLIMAGKPGCGNLPGFAGRALYMIQVGFVIGGMFPHPNYLVDTAQRRLPRKGGR